MSRIQITFPEKFIFTTDLPVRVADVNYGGHVGNDSIVTIMQEARALFYRSLGFKSEVSIEGTIGQVVADVAVVYKSESFFGDVLVVQIGVQKFHRFGFDLVYRITNKATGKEAARGKTGIVCFDYERRKMAEVPVSLKSALDFNRS